MRINAIVCVNQKNAIGLKNELLYNIPNDLANFKRLTEDKIVIVGKNTFESLPKRPLPNRTTIIVSNDEHYIPSFNSTEKIKEDVFVVNDIMEAISTARTLINENDDEDIFVIGGAQLYTSFINSGLIDRVYMTEVMLDDDGDTFFPNIKETWVTRFKTEIFSPTNKNSVPYRYLILEQY